jgi:glycosyltransferase involved in cell wall biosynthesis
MSVQLSKDFRDSIASRARFVLETSGNKPSSERNWFDLIQDVSRLENGFFFVLLALTGSYPDKFEYKDFVSQTKIYGLSQATQNILANRLKQFETAKDIISVELVLPRYPQLVDVTHTYFAPYLTGIQRVVFGVTEGPSNISTYIWVGDSGHIKEVSYRKIEASEKVSSEHGWRTRLVHFLHSCVPKIAKTRTGRVIYTLALPTARVLKRRLITSEVEKESAGTSNEKSTNVLIMNSIITIPEIPASLKQISIYESILENEIAPVQIILYDFIPFFHAWTVHPGNRGHLNSYIRLVLLASRIISISSLVQEQVKLINQAFRLERNEWSSRKQNFDYMTLPSGLKPINSGEFKKQEDLVVMAGSLEPRKNHTQFLSAIELLSKEGVRVKARILGSAGWENEQILEKINDLQVKGIDIERLVNLTDSGMRKLIAEAQVLLQISEAEGFGLPIAEALALGTKVIVSNIRPLNEWQDSRVSIVELGDIEQLKNELSNILNNPEKEGRASAPEITWNDWHRLLYDEQDFTNKA